LSFNATTSLRTKAQTHCLGLAETDMNPAKTKNQRLTAALQQLLEQSSVQQKESMTVQK